MCGAALSAGRSAKGTPQLPRVVRCEGEGAVTERHRQHQEGGWQQPDGEPLQRGRPREGEIVRLVTGSPSEFHQ
eukprot:9473027-Pyramimonas_sp.AAC.1